VRYSAVGVGVGTTGVAFVIVAPSLGGIARGGKPYDNQVEIPLKCVKSASTVFLCTFYNQVGAEAAGSDPYSAVGLGLTVLLGWG